MIATKMVNIKILVFLDFIASSKKERGSLFSLIGRAFIDLQEV